MLTFLLAVVLGAGGLALLIYLVRLLITAAGFPLAGAFERFRFRQHLQRAQQADRLLQQGQIDAALPLLRDSFCFILFRDMELARSVANHHTGLLSRVLSITDETVRPLSLAKVDRLLRERRELDRNYRAARQSPGKNARRRELAAKLAANSGELAPAIRQMIEEVRAASAHPRYH